MLSSPATRHGGSFISNKILRISIRPEHIFGLVQEGELVQRQRLGHISGWAVGYPCESV